ncbi:hypothetical protein IW492_10425 [Enterococcus sp. BWB1-3]|uniref:CdaR family protein n=1 Tax=unclassified Enterococcus TaxID=2608891 RepID=UPI0019205D8B|nr:MULTISPECIES: CdaR family protein [unclassified Enterococcus]MBL1229644.1 hypothetical protein [Enterococcus sp. BWB1-3]MCB5956196.1 hypothetical protein [Enterococcus sp. CWB-B31]
MKKAYESNWFSGLLALLFALLLFFNANSNSSSTNTATNNQVYDEVLYNIPVKLEYDEDTYFVSGYEDSVTVHLSSANRIQLNLETNEDTRNFRVEADLTNLSLGTAEVPLRVTGISSAVTAELDPATITVTIENKVTKAFDVEAQIPESFNTEGYKVDSISISPKTVDITTGEDTMAEIVRVVAPLTSVTQSADTIRQTVNVQALDSKGQILSIENPAPQVKVSVKLSLPKKEVALKIVSTGSLPSDITGYTFNTSEQVVEISGSNSVLESIDSIEVPVDISDIRTSIRKTVNIPVNGDYTVNPSQIEVTIIPIYAGFGTSDSISSSTPRGTDGNGTADSSNTVVSSAESSENNQGSTEESTDSTN